MDKQQARSTIKETFEQSFDKTRFIAFIKNLLNRIEEAPFTYQGQYIPDAYKPYISILERIGKFSEGENRIDILAITLKKETSLERARTMQRNFVAWYLNGSRGGELKDAALVAFVSPDQIDWRFSLVKMDYKFEETKTGKIKVKEEFTPARRWSFLVGVNERSHTAQSRLVNILANDEQVPTLKEIENAFDIETVTKEFFLKYRGLFIRTKEALDKVVKNDARIKADFEAKGVNTVDFVKKLLGQIVFLYFLQKKGWFGVGRDADWGTGSKQFLRELFEKKHGEYKNFFNDILEPLFYEALRNDRSHADDYYSRFNCKIPFLNGGLFDPIGNYDWVHTDIHLPDSLFSNKNKTKEGDTGDGVLDIFDRYNFTVKEDEPLEKEVAIDPELLGKAYEKFNAIRPDNFEEYKKALKSGKKGDESKFNKQFGVYYTPREIVHYMCRQSLINYLHTELAEANNHSPNNHSIFIKEDIETLFHIGEQVSENEARVESKGKETSTYSYKLPESIRKNAVLIDRKLADITVCDPAVGSGAFPVGMMSEIVKARTVLTTFIEKKQNRKSYDFKRRCIEHSLYGVDIDPGAVEIAKLRLWLSLVVDEDDITNIKPLPNLDYKIVCGNSLVGVEKNLFNNQFFIDLEKLKLLFFNETNPTKKQDFKKQIDELISKITSGHTEFDFAVYFSELFHNKAGFDVVIANPPYIFSRERITKEEKDYYNRAYTQTQFKINTYILFTEKGHRLLKNSGCLSYIIPNNWLTLETASQFRNFILRKTFSIQIVNIIDKVFESASVDNCILMFSKTGKNEILICELENGKFKTALKNHPDVFINANNNIISYESQKSGKHISLCQKIALVGTSLESIAEVKNGIQAYTVGEGTPPQTEKMKTERVYHSLKKSDSTWQKYVDGVDVERYRIGWSKQFVKYGKNLSRPRTKDLFVGERLLVRQIPARPPYAILACYVNENLVNDNNSMIVIKPKSGHSIKYLLGILNSRLISFWFIQTFGKMQRKVFPQFKVKELRAFPIRAIDFFNSKDKSLHKDFVELVDRILSVKRENPQADTSAWEREIDQLVYELYGLTPEEIKIVEGGI